MIDQEAIRQKLPSPVRQARGTNASLWLDKYIRNQKREDVGRRELVNDVVELPEPPEYAAYFRRWEAMLDSYNAQTRRIQVQGRMVVGLGSESLLEASICLHRTYGVPYIPGSALKGLAVNYAHHRLGEEWSRGGKFHNLVFGNGDEAGYITFFDALLLPTEHRRSVLAPDIITVHHQKYYQKAGAPTDRDDPNPIPFLSATGQYLLALGAPDFQGQTRWIDLTFQILAGALDKLGIGAKTSSGYGRMTFIDPPIKPADPQMVIAEGYKREVMALRNVAGEINAYYQKWKLLTMDEARELLARAILEKIEQARRTKASAEKTWYQDLRSFVDKQ